MLEQLEKEHVDLAVGVVSMAAVLGLAALQPGNSSLCDGSLAARKRGAAIGTALPRRAQDASERACAELAAASERHQLARKSKPAGGYLGRRFPSMPTLSEASGACPSTAGWPGMPRDADQQLRRTLSAPPARPASGSRRPPAPAAMLSVDATPAQGSLSPPDAIYRHEEEEEAAPPSPQPLASTEAPPPPAARHPPSPAAPTPLPVIHVSVPSPMRIASLESLEGLAAAHCFDVDDPDVP